ncbi:DUF1326 domain-containing protein [Sinorhizobium meliloti]|jgi:hypothetical protein|uniref:DUF1326 domain-containing protein n=1 Tax=Rhizobium meliloti TaxID=382 RepID=UPI000FDB2C22|nr:DUF1326 domain-containing protein [Sinorhizobium meliloti]RVE99276.1 DUF1326 domain-containing protein [Sinorhizobium meliloti]RVH41138.1 DUF1326 domain-containing protein [Sinorhizobium meliloti]RVK07453.1 DUF1326 domain-containing protein [Sinorhizobium meliloti]
MTDWELHGMEFGNCNCSYGCPCQFNALPTHGHCQAIGFFTIARGNFGAAKLDGLNMAIAVAWPGAVHEGRGVMQPIIDERADDAQRRALFSILTGEETDPMATFWAVYTAMCETVCDPIYTAISIDVDMKARRAKCKAESVAIGRGEPIVNPVTGEEHRVGILLPNGFEYERNEVGRGWSSSFTGVPLNLEDSYAHWCELHFNQHGRIQ